MEEKSTHSGPANKQPEPMKLIAIPDEPDRSLPTSTPAFSLFLASVVALVAAPVVFISMQQEKSGKETYNNAMTSSFNNSFFHIQDQHSVIQTSEDGKYAYDFNAKTVATNPARNTGAEHANLVPFEKFEDQTAIETARKQACLITEKAEDAKNPGWPHREKFETSQHKAASFAKNHCP